MPAKKETNVVSEEVAQGRALDLGEIGDPGPIEPAAENDIRLEAFMNDKLRIIVHETAEDGQLQIICPQVNGTNQPIIRGKETMVKRKYVEALARCSTTKYTQTTPDASKPDNIQMIPRRAITYPFTVLEDPHPNGAEWLRQIKAQE